MIFTLDVRRARKGDCLLLHFGSKTEPGLIMIDGGPRNVYTPHLKPRIQQIRKARKLADNEPLNVDLLMVSHVDDDHIQGILELTGEMLVSQAAHKPLPLRVLNFWHNSFDNIIGNDPKELAAGFEGKFGAASTTTELPNDITVDADDPNLEEEVIVSSLKVLASIKQGAKLRGDAKKLKFPSNLEFDGKLILAAEDGGPIDIADGLTLTVVGPMQPELKKLHDKHDAWLKELKKKGMTPEEALAAYVDKSVPNLSSIVVLAQAGDKSILLTGDARGDKILEGLEMVGLLDAHGRMKVHLLKVPHHGSANNLDDDFFERLTADHYVFSGNGEHGNPERESLEMLVKARGAADFTIHLTYPIDELDVERKADWEKEQAKDKRKEAKNPAKKVREDWSAKKHSLGAFFDAHPGLIAKVKIVDADKAHLIDLGDPLKSAWPELA